MDTEGSRCFELAAQGKLQELKSLLVAAGNHHRVRTRTDSRGRTLLHVAAKHGRTDVANYLLELDPSSLDLKDADGNTALHLAAMNNHLEVADLLLSSGASAVSQNNRKVLPLHIALQNGSSTDMISVFTKHTVDIQARGFRDYTSLHVVAANNNLEALKVLYESALSCYPDTISDNVLLQSVDRDGLTPIHLAARKGSHDVLEFMITKAIEHGLKLRIVLERLSEKDSTPLHFAVESNAQGIVRVLLRHGASPTISNGKQGPPIHLACSQNKLNLVRVMVEQCGQEIVNCKNNEEQTPLHSCAPLIAGKELISYLLSQGSMLDTQDANGRTPLQIAVRYGNVTSVDQLLASGSSPLVKDSCGCNSLHLAIMFKRREVFIRLLKHPSATEMSDTPNNDGDFPIHLALREGLSSYVAPLLETTLCQATDRDNNNYLHLAALAGDKKTIETLLACSFAKSMINATNSTGKTPLHCSAINGDLMSISLLLDHGAVVNKCYLGLTPFMYACLEGRLASAKVLYEAHPFQRDWKDDRGNTALHLAASSGSADVTTYCLDLGMVIGLNGQQKSFFDIIIEAADSSLATAVLQHERWEECLDVASPNKPHPVIRLLNQIPNVFQVILDNSITRSPLDALHEDYWEEYNFKYVSLRSQVPDSDGYEMKAKDTLGSGDTSSSTNQDEALVEIAATARSVSRSDTSQVLLEMESLNINQEHEHISKDANVNLEVSRSTQLAADFDTTLITTDRHKKKQVLGGHQATDGSEEQSRGANVPSMKVLKLLAKKRSKRYLTHPVVVKYLHLKWVDYARTLYVGKLLMILLQTIFLSTFIGIAPVPSPRGPRMPADIDPSINTSNTSSLLENNPDAVINTAANVIRFVTIFFATLNAIIMFSTIYVMRFKLIAKFISEFEFWFYSAAVISTLVYLIPFQGLNSVVPEAGVIAVFLSWCVTLFQFELFSVDILGIHVSMLISTTKNVVKVLSICFFLFCAFAFSFHILVGSFSELQFTNIGTSLISSFSAALAIIDLNAFVALEFAGLLPFPVLTFIFYVLLLILLPIVLINLLIGLAVGDIAKIQEEAEINRQVVVVTNLSKVDKRLLPKNLLCKFCRMSYKCYPNRVHTGTETQISGMLVKLRNMLMDSDQNSASTELESGLDNSNKELLTMQRQVDQLMHMQTKQAEAMTRIEVMLQKLMEHQDLECDPEY